MRVTGGQPYTWQVKGRPVPPAYQWTGTGLNFLGFSTPASPPTLEAFLAQAPSLRTLAKIYRYNGGELSTNNPAVIPDVIYRKVPVKRGQAFWIGPTNTYNRYFGPFELALQSSSGLNFGDSLGQASVRVRNVTSNALTVTLRFLASESSPADQTPAPLQLLLRGASITTNLTYPYMNLPVNGSHSWLLPPGGQPGSEVEVVLGVNRSRMSGSAGSLYAGILRFTDSLGHLELNIPASATVASTAGLWVGLATVTRVGHYLVSYQRSVQTNYAQAPNGEPIIDRITTNLAATAKGQYIPANTNTTLGKVARPFPLRLILHNPASGNATLLQRAYFGLRQQTNLVVATRENLLDPQHLDSARRISAAHLPWSAGNAPHLFDGRLAPGARVKASVLLDYNDQASNPFLHTYHPDHDNLNASFDATPVEPQGRESYTVARVITLTVTGPRDDFASVTSDTGTLVGQYAESVTVAGQTNETRRFEASGAFILNRVSDIATLTTN